MLINFRLIKWFYNILLRIELKFRFVNYLSLNSYLKLFVCPSLDLFSFGFLRVVTFVDDPDGMDGMDGMDDADEQNDSITVKVEPDFVHLSTGKRDNL